MFERFTDRARRVVVQAQEEARLLHHNYIGTEHFLLGLLGDADSVAARALDECGVSREAARNQVIEIVGTGSRAPSGQISFTPRAKKALELALREAMQLGHDYIGTEHMLLGLIREGEGVGAQVLHALGADLSRVRHAVLLILTGGVREAAEGSERGQRDELLRRLERERGVRGNVSLSWSGGTTEESCSFCGGDLWDLGYFVAGNSAAICEECVTAAAVVVADARAEDLSSDVPLQMPARASGTIPDEAAVRAIQEAFVAVFGGRDPSEAFDDVLEDAEALTASRLELRARVPQAAGTVTHVERIRFDAPDRARVRFTITPRGIGAFRFEGDAMRRGDHWIVSRDTWCQVVARGGVQCPPPSE